MEKPKPKAHSVYEQAAVPVDGVRLTFVVDPSTARKLRQQAKDCGQLFSYYLRQCVLRDAGLAK